MDYWWDIKTYYFIYLYHTYLIWGLRRIEQLSNSNFKVVMPLKKDNNNFSCLLKQCCSCRKCQTCLSLYEKGTDLSVQRCLRLQTGFHELLVSVWYVCKCMSVLVYVRLQHQQWNTFMFVPQFLLLWQAHLFHVLVTHLKLWDMFSQTESKGKARSKFTHMQYWVVSLFDWPVRNDNILFYSE